MYKAHLIPNIKHISDEKLSQIKALKHVSNFIQEASNQAAYDDSLSAPLKLAGQLLSRDFGSVDKNISNLVSSDRRVVPFLRSQLFIALIANLEDYFSQIMKEILISFPEKITTKKIDKSLIIESSNKLQSIEKLAFEMIMDILYKSPSEYRKEFEKITSTKTDLLEPYWESYVEMKATRDTGMHGGWKVNQKYVEKAEKKARNTVDGSFLQITKDYFDEALILGEQIVISILKHISEKFKACTYSFVFQEMWNKSSLSTVVSFDQAWRIESNYMVRPRENFSWGWSHSEIMMFNFFKSIYHDEDSMPPLTKLFQRLAKTDVNIINSWLEAPFFFGDILKDPLK
ncbi:hypothetical protein [Bacillus cereus]|uniref:Uncharacterized protein n=1 Tax=Bacillus cereus TaxID=1396 RepID=A0A1S9UIT0_BACCE|nr:hypothetical protein [Bacillus cereus]OOR22142.1 hypothetical protein BW892_20290 [Bacillus cereus]